jgi:uncharacterized coiled-coil protein SlyX
MGLNGDEVRQAKTSNLIQLVGLAVALLGSFVYHSGRITALEVKVATNEQTLRDVKPAMESVIRIETRLGTIESQLETLLNSQRSKK